MVQTAWCSQLEIHRFTVPSERPSANDLRSTPSRPKPSRGTKNGLTGNFASLLRKILRRIQPNALQPLPRIVLFTLTLLCGAHVCSGLEAEFGSHVILHRNLRFTRPQSPRRSNSQRNSFRCSGQSGILTTFRSVRSLLSVSEVAESSLSCKSGASKSRFMICVIRARVT